MLRTAAGLFGEKCMLVRKAVSKYLLRFAPVFLLSFGAAPLATAQDTPNTPPPQFGEWQMQCDPPQGPARQCALVQTASPGGNVGLYADVLLIKLEQGKLLMRIIAPLGVLVPSGVGLSIDGSDVGTTGFSRCYISGCLADVLVDDALRKRLVAGKDAALTLHQTPDASLDFAFKLDGVTQGLPALPPPPKPPRAKAGKP